jgi:transaldolase
MDTQALRTKIFLDSGDPAETRQAIELLGFLDGQTTNPSLMVKNPVAQERLKRGDKFTKEEIYSFYQKTIQEISALIPNGSVSVEVYADKNSTVEEIVKQSQEMFAWAPNLHVKIPLIKNGLAAVELLAKESVRMNVTLCFSEEQALAVYLAANRIFAGQIFISPFVGRLDDQGENGMDLIKNIIKLYDEVDSKVEVLVASVRTLDHFLYSLQLGAGIITAPLKILKEWKEKGMVIPSDDYAYPVGNLKPIDYQNLKKENWQDCDICHGLTDAGLDKFASEWNGMIRE